ncbi:MAG TPA: hypothetical protein VGP72_30955 [Planctomycetota bacterium]
MENERDGVTGGRGDGGKQHDGEHDGAGKDVCGTNCGAAANLTPRPPSLGGKGEKGSARDAGGTAGAGELTGEELKNPWKAMFSGGVVKMFEARKALTAQELGDAGAGGDEDVFRFVAECEKFGDAEAEKRREERYERRMRAQAVERVPLWMQVSGLFPDDEPKMSPRERLGAMLLLVKNAERLLRYEIKYSGEQKSEIDAAEVRTYLWDPLRTVCFHLGISQRRLTSYCKELTGMSAIEMVDRIKAEGVRGKIKEELRKFISTAETQRRGERIEEEHDGNSPSPLTPLPRGGEGNRSGGRDARTTEEADEVFAALKKSRRDGRWHRTTWAMGMGFSSYQRFFRACLLCFGKTPHELEMELIEEILKEAERETGGVTTGSAVAVRKSEGEEQREEKREAGVSVT